MFHEVKDEGWRRRKLFGVSRKKIGDTTIRVMAEEGEL
jgi:hypothetical protein